MQTPAKTMFLQVGQRRYQVVSFEQASAMICRARDASGMGASETGCSFQIFDGDGAGVAYVSYNGRVWPGTPRQYIPNATPLYPVDGGYVQ